MMSGLGKGKIESSTENTGSSKMRCVGACVALYRRSYNHQRDKFDVIDVTFPVSSNLPSCCRHYLLTTASDVRSQISFLLRE